ncbi:MAG: 2,3-bisphosphoglycerate-independent phosphoglycerate mutase [Sedimentisphaerales bacterium]|nr:2,3-bisphosphoglycerate-independent phosphoglycerate mutase [Sedimentisphaerales bacterium]
MSSDAAKSSSVTLRKRPFVLIIRDGWGHNDDASLAQWDATKVANTPVDDMLTADYPHCLVATYGENVGLPDGTMGNSEVGHQNIGAGRIVYQESMRLTKAIRDGDFFENEVLLKAIDRCAANNSKLHLMGLISDAGVHSLLNHLYGLLELAKRKNMPRVYLHGLMDGRDTPPNSGREFIATVEAKMKEMGIGEVASLMGRFWGMDRDQRWNRVERAYQCLRYGKGDKFDSADAAMEASYANDVTDEFVEPTVITGDDGQPKAVIEDGDSMVFFNFRGDRPREITRAFVDEHFEHFDRGGDLDVYWVCMTQYDATIKAPVAFPKGDKMKNIVGEYWSNLGLKQFRCAETEKYAHVTFFFNDYREQPFKGEDRQIVPSPKVETYDKKPEMSAQEVADKVLERLDLDEYDAIVVNFANPDMVGHTGVMAAAIVAAETVDRCVGQILDKVKAMGGSAIITADHGNLEKMYDPITKGPFTAHTTGVVPLIVFDEELKGAKLRDDGILADVIPTGLELMGLEQPAEMTGRSLIVR